MKAADPITARFIEAALRTLAEEPARVLDRGLNRDRLVELSGAAAATFSRKFRTKQVFLDAIAATLPPPVICGADELRAEIERIDAAGQRGDRAIHELVLRRYQALTEPRRFAGQLLAHWLAPSDGRLRARLRDSYRQRDDAAHAVLDAAFERVGVTLRRPLGAGTLAVAVNALLEGLQLRMRAEPEVVTAELLANAVSALLNGAIDVEERHRPVGDPAPKRAPVALPSNPRAAVIAAARLEFGNRGYFNTGMEHVAETSGVPRDKLELLFPSKIHIIEAALRTPFDQLGTEITDAAAFDVDAATTIRRYLLGCARLIGAETVFMDTLLVAVAHDTYGAPERIRSVKTQLNLPAIIEPVVERGQKRRELADDHPPAEVAAWLTNAILLRCFTFRDRSAEENAAFAADVALRGVLLD
ncbi:TetR/AcrR family transcriptional regulator [Nocardia harenae]|uniref:TetR/AcrR family transcriptional regulator n=1 Tax=Nocardia harenae TaxID=358707 RepID=UPI00082ACD25|nr:TetR/AcrR family transcriptional regulator [Nocardia harenae]